MAESALGVDAPKNDTWNFNVNLVDIIFITIGMSLVSRETVMPVLVSTLTDSKLAIGLIPAIWALGYYLPQLLTASFTERLRFKKPFVMVVGSVGERFPYLFTAITIWAFALGRADMDAGTLLRLHRDGRVQCRHRYTGLVRHDRQGDSGATARHLVWDRPRRGRIAGGRRCSTWWRRVLETVLYPNNFALLFALAFFFVMISWVGLSLTT